MIKQQHISCGLGLRVIHGKWLKLYKWKGDPLFLYMHALERKRIPKAWSSYIAQMKKAHMTTSFNKQNY